MIHSLSLKQFRNFSSREISFCAWKNIIIWKNGHGKSNILEALSLPVAPMVESQMQYLVAQGSDVFFLGYELDWGKQSISYEVDGMKRRYLCNGKSTTKAKFSAWYPHVVAFHPLGMNLMYLGPSERRNFLDTALCQAYPEYQKILQNYKKILISRNKVLKNISEGKSSHAELDFWDRCFIEATLQIVWYRQKIRDFFQKESSNLKKYLFWKVENISFQYISKIPLEKMQDDFASALLQERSKEILLRKTLRWPHLDDFTLLLDGVEIIHYASRWEIKSLLLGLKFIESSFLADVSHSKDILFLLDDLLSELDSDHRDMLWEHIGERQCVVTCIEDEDLEGNKIYI